MKSQLWGTALLGFACAFLAGQAQASPCLPGQICFDNLANGTTVTNQYAGVLFSSSTPDVILVYNDPFDNFPTGNNVICTGPVPSSPPPPTPTIDCTHDVVLQFTGFSASHITFDALANQSPVGQAFATVDVFTNTINHLGIPLLVTHTTHGPPPATDETPDPQSISFPGITGITIHPSASEASLMGTEYDNFVITQDSSVTVPEPASFLLTGFCGLALLCCKLRARKRA